MHKFAEKTMPFFWQKLFSKKPPKISDIRNLLKQFIHIQYMELSLHKPDLYENIKKTPTYKTAYHIREL